MISATAPRRYGVPKASALAASLHSTLLLPLPPYLYLLSYLLGGQNSAVACGPSPPRTLLKPSQNLLIPYENHLKPFQTCSEPQKTFQNLFKTTKTLGKPPRGPSRTPPGPPKINIFNLQTSEIQYLFSPEH